MSTHIDVINIKRKRGDDFPIQFTLTDETTGLPVDITGFVFQLVMDPALAPVSSANNVLNLTATLVTPLSGIYEFRPSIANMDITPGPYYYEVQMTDGTSKLRTILEGRFDIEQDIVK